MQLMSSKLSEDFIDEITRQKKSSRKGKFQLNHTYIDRATEEFIKSGKTINKVIPDWEKEFESFINLPVDTMGGADLWLIS